MQKVYNFALFDDCSDQLVMSTQLDELNPMIDSEFWDRFLQGDCLMVYQGFSFEQIED
jgi:hypothetical protein